MCSYAFQARLELVCETGFRPRRDLSGYRAEDWDLRIADLHYRDVCEWAVGRNAAAGWDAPKEQRRASRGSGPIRCRSAEVERVAPNEEPDLKARVTFGMEALAQLAARAMTLGPPSALADLPALYGAGSRPERNKLDGLPASAQRRRER